MILVERCHHQLITARPDRCWQVMQRIHCLHICSQQPFMDWPHFHRPNININLLVCGSPSKLFLCLVSEEKIKRRASTSFRRFFFFNEILQGREITDRIKDNRTKGKREPIIFIEFIPRESVFFTSERRGLFAILLSAIENTE